MIHSSDYINIEVTYPIVLNDAGASTILAGKSNYQH